MGVLKFLLQVVLFIATIGLIVYGFYQKECGTYSFKPSKKIALALIPLTLFIATMCITFVGANTVGIRWSAFGGTSEKTLSEGIVLKSPFDKIYTIDTTVQERTIKAVTVQTEDSQFVTMEINVKYKVDKDNAFKVFKGYKTLDSLKKNIIGNYAQKSVEIVSINYNITDILGSKKDELYAKATEQLSTMLEKEGVTLVQITIKDMDAGEEIENSIKEEAVAKKAVETAKQQQEKVKIEAETKVIKAQGEADANAIQTEALTEEVLRKMMIEKWDGSMPKVVSNDNGSIIDYSSLLK